MVKENNKLSGLWNKLKQKTYLWVITIITGLLTTCSQSIVDNIKSGFDMSQLRTQYFNIIANDLSKFNFDAETMFNIYYETKFNETIGVGFSKTAADDYNKDIENLRSKEFLYRAQIDRVWGSKFIVFNTNKVKEFDDLFDAIKILDNSIHLTNTIGVNIINTNEKTYKLTSYDKNELTKILPSMKRNLDKVNTLTKKILQNLS